MISRFLFLVLLGSASVMVDGQDCDLVCNDRGTCKLGNANTTGQPSAVVGNDVSSVDGMSCDCEVGFSGVQCERTTQFCDESTHVCYHGGKCVKGEIQTSQQTVHVCDCRNATESGIKYVGLHCEKESPIDHPDTDADPLPDGAVVCKLDTQDFCLNNGSCNFNAQPGENICNCPTGYTGYHCEFSREGLNAADANTEEATTPGSCSVKCENGGSCQVGFRNATSAELAFNSSFDPNDHVTKFEHCRCPDGFSGAFCEKNHTTCGTLHCFHGSECTTNPQTNANYCKCTSNLTTSFAGIGCQHHSTSFCTSSQGLNGHQFCTNNGQCVSEGNQIFSCNCTSNFQGPHCEFPAGIALPETHKDCNLKCENGGKCAEGTKTHGVLSIIDIKEIDHLLNNTAGRNTNDYEHCVCPTGFAGDTCETDAKVCPDGQHVCFHKSECVADGEDWKCDCTQSDVGNPTAGTYCQHKATTVCNAATRAFCVNEGKCGNDGTCDCPGGFRGPHCEFSFTQPDDDNVPISVPKESLPQDYKSRANETIIVSAAIVAGLAVIFIIGTVLVTAKSGEEFIETGPAPPPMTAFPPASPAQPSIIEEANVEGDSTPSSPKTSVVEGSVADGNTASKDAANAVPPEEEDDDHVNEII